MALILKLLALVAFLGGPLMAMDRWRAELGEPVAFTLAFAPLALLLFGMLSIDDEPGRCRTIVVRGGAAGALLLLVQNALALAWLMTQARAPKEPIAMHALGIAVGTAVAVYYLMRARRGPPSSAELIVRLEREALIRDWMLLAISCAFVIAGIALLWKAPDTAIITIVFFGACGIVPVSSLLRRRRAQRASTVAATLTLPADRTLRPMRSRAVALFGGMLGLGVVIFYFSARYSPTFRWLIALVAVIGLCGLVAVALGYAPVGYLRFDAGQLTLGMRGYAMHVPWSACTAVIVGEYMNNPAVFVHLDDAASVHASPPEQTAKAHKALQRNESWCGAPIMILTTPYDFDPEALAAAIEQQMRAAA